MPLCSGLSGLFLCELGTCWNITAAFSCRWRGEDTEPPLNCYYKRNCIELAGMYSCQAGHCTKYTDYTATMKGLSSANIYLLLPVLQAEQLAV